MARTEATTQAPSVTGPRGRNQRAVLRLLGGHEGAGVVAEVGPGVRSVQPGDRVPFSFIPACGTCRSCVSGMTYICASSAFW